MPIYHSQMNIYIMLYDTELVYKTYGAYMDNSKIVISSPTIKSDMATAINSLRLSIFSVYAMIPQSRCMHSCLLILLMSNSAIIHQYTKISFWDQLHNYEILATLSFPIMYIKAIV